LRVMEPIYIKFKSYTVKEPGVDWFMI